MASLIGLWRLTLPQMLLTAKFVEAAKPTDKKQDFSDTKSPNLVLMIRPKPSGSKTWLWRGRLDGRVKVFTLGQFPIHSLDAARTWANEITEGRDHGINAIEDKAKKEKAEAAAAAQTCDWLFDLYMEHEGSERKTASEKRRMYDLDIKPVIGAKSIGEVDHDMLMAILRKKHKVAPIQSNALQALIRRWFKWSVSLGRDLTGMKVNPATDLVKLAKPVSRDRHLDDYEIGLFFKSLRAMKTTMQAPLTLILYTGVRRSEAFEAPWAEFDLTKGEWFIPGERTKNRVPLMLPLPAEMVTMLKARKALAGESSLVFPSRQKKDGVDVPMTGFSKTMSWLLKKMNFFATKDGRTIEPFTIHDLRRSLSSGMNGLLDSQDKPIVPSEIVERIINHKIGGVAGIYNRHEYYAEKKAALRAWADHLEALKKLFEIEPALLPAPVLLLGKPQVDLAGEKALAA